MGSFLGCGAADLVIRDIAVHPVSGNVYLSVRRGHGDAAQPVLIRVGRLDASVTDVPLDSVAFAEMIIEDAPEPGDERQDITLPRRGGRGVPDPRWPDDPHPAPADPHLNGDGPGLHKRGPAGGGPVE